jgi:hypothetical protein
MKRPTVHSFLELEGQLNELCGGKSDFDVEAAEEIIGRIKEICSRLPPLFFGAESRPYGEWFCEKLKRRGKSSGDYLDYSIARSRLLEHFAEIHVKRQTHNLKEKARQRHQENADRNIALAYEYLRIRNKGSPRSDSALKEDIGRKSLLKRSASIAAIDDGLRRLGNR